MATTILKKKVKKTRKHARWYKPWTYHLYSIDDEIALDIETISELGDTIEAVIDTHDTGYTPYDNVDVESAEDADFEDIEDDENPAYENEMDNLQEIKSGDDYNSSSDDTYESSNDSDGGDE